MTAVNLLEHGAKGDGTGNDAAAIQAAIDACGAAGGGRVVVPSGRAFRTGPFELRSGVELHLEHASRIEAIPDRSLYLHEVLPPSFGDGRRWIYAQEAEDIAITGTGVIDGRGVDFMTENLPHIYRTTVGRPFVLSLEGCHRITIKDVTMRDAPFWTVHLLGCEDVLISGVQILNDLKVPNGDGIDPHRCRNVRIVGCHITAADDCICPKAEEGLEKFGAMEDLVVTACTLESTSCAIKLGSGTHADMRRFVFDNCIIKGSHRGIGLQLRDGGTLEDMIFSNMVIETRLFDRAWWGDATAVYVTAFPRTPDTALGKIRNVRFTNLVCRGESGVYLASDRPGAISHVTFDRVSLHLAKWSKHAGGFYDRRPGSADPLIQEEPTSAFRFDTAANVMVRDCDVTWGDDPPDHYRHALAAHRVRGLEIDGLRGTSAFPDRFENVVTTG